jgi:hypothetical protein
MAKTTRSDQEDASRCPKCGHRFSINDMYFECGLSWCPTCWKYRRMNPNCPAEVARQGVMEKQRGKEKKDG